MVITILGNYIGILIVVLDIILEVFLSPRAGVGSKGATWNGLKGRLLDFPALRFHKKVSAQAGISDLLDLGGLRFQAG